MPKKLFACLLVMALSASVLTGCFGSEKKPDSSSAPYSSGTSSGSMHSGSSAHSGSTSSDKVHSGNASSDSGAHSGSTHSENSTASGASGSAVPESGVSDAAFSDSARAAEADASDGWMTRLVNASHPLPEDFTVETSSIPGYDKRFFDRRAAPMLEAMLADAEKSGNKLYLVSGYRSIKRQQALFKRKTQSFLAEGFDQDEAERQAALWVARPGTSEHNTGLAADIVSAGWYAHNDDLTAEFENTPEFEWLSQNCASYGFILRYPKGKEEVTGVVYEPWHYRFVGKEAAAFITEHGLTLEEYTERGM